MKREDCRRGKAGKDHHWFTGGRSEANRFTGLQRDAVRYDAWIRQSLHHAIGQVALTLAGASGQEHNICLCETICESLFQRSFFVRDDSQHPRHAAQFPHGIGQNACVGIVYRTQAGRLTRRDDLITR